MTTSKLDEILVPLTSCVEPPLCDECAKLVLGAKQAIVEAVEGLIPEAKDTQITVEHISETARITTLHPQAQGFNECREQVLEAIKEWQ